MLTLLISLPSPQLLDHWHTQLFLAPYQHRQKVRSVKSWVLVSLILSGTLVFVEGASFFVERVLKPHHQNRIKTWVNPKADPLGIGWNTPQAKIAIGSGGLWGKGYLHGTQKKYGFVPEQSTDFIFCTIGEELGWVGASLIIVTLLAEISRILYISERQRLRLARVYGYAIASVLFFHFMVYVGLTISLMPIVGLPLPRISYGGSSLCAFSLLLSILLRLDAERKNNLYRQHRLAIAGSASD